VSTERRGDTASSGGRYRRLRSRLWLEPRFATLTDVEKLAALYVLSGPQSTATGLYRLSPASAAEDLRCTTHAFQRRFEAARQALGWHFDAAARIIWLPEWIEENPPQNPNQVRAWRAAFDEIPDCPLKARAAAVILAFLERRGEPFAEPFRQASITGSGDGLPSRSRHAGPVQDTLRAERRLLSAKNTERVAAKVRLMRDEETADVIADRSIERPQ
jgi:hypothetical protein